MTIGYDPFESSDANDPEKQAIEQEYRTRLRLADEFFSRALDAIARIQDEAERARQFEVDANLAEQRKAFAAKEREAALKRLEQQRNPKASSRHKKKKKSMKLSFKKRRRKPGGHRKSGDSEGKKDS